jgi:hypothetical protein
MEDAFTHPGEFTGIKSPGVSYGRCVYSSMKSLLESGVQKFHKKDVITHPWRVLWYRESKSSIRKIRFLITKSLLISGVQKFNKKSVFLIRGESTGI